MREDPLPEERSEGGTRIEDMRDENRAGITHRMRRVALVAATFFALSAAAVGTHDSQPREAATAAAEAKWVSPMPGAEVTSCWGRRQGTLHKGIDFAQPENTPVNAASKGRVVGAGSRYTGYGISVVIDHGDGIFTHYAHLNKTKVRKGQKVTAGQLIGHEGSTGDSTGPHLHFEVHKGLWNQVNPGPWMRARGVDVKC